MPELRKDPIVDRWVIFSEARTRRPSDYPEAPPEARKGRDRCPFCPGHEAHTPPEVLAYRDHGGPPNGAGWSTRVIPNKFPALTIEGGLDRSGEGIYDRMNGVGAHEVIIESPEHDLELSELKPAQIERVLRAIRDRMADLQNDHRFRYILAFKNHGARAGASLEHGHSQLIATPILPHVLAEELESCERHYQLKERCVFCDIIDQETRDRRRLVLEQDGFLSIAPFAPRVPFETWILPRRHAAAFDRTEDRDWGALASILKETLGRIRCALDRPHYNFAIHTAPCRDPELPHYHWHVEITPRQPAVAAFEWGSGFHINPVSPETAAEYLREIQR